MKDILPDIDKLFLDAEQLHKDAPSDKVWDAIERNLDKRTVVNITRRYDRMKWVAAILLFLLGSVSAYIFLKPNAVATSVFKADGSKIKNKPLPALRSNPKPDSTSNPLNDNVINNINRVNNKDSVEFRTPNAPVSNTTSNFNSQTVNNPNEKSPTINKNSTTIISAPKNLGPTPFKNISTLHIEDNSGRIKNIKEDYLNNSVLSFNSSPLSYTNNNSSLIHNTSNVEKDLDFVLSPQQDLINNNSLNYSSPNSRTTELELSRTGIKNSSTYKKYINRSSSKGRLELTGFYSPDFGFDHLKDDKPPRPGLDRQHVRDNEQHSFSYTTGITAGLKINNLITVQGGIAFSQSGKDNRPKTISAEKDAHGDIKYRFDASCGFGYFLPHNGPPPREGDSLIGVSSHNTLQFVQVPVTVKFSKHIKNLSLTAVTGLSLNKLISGMINTTVNNANIKESQTISSVEGLKKYSLSGIIGAGAEYKINKALSFSFSPTVRIAVTSINSGSSVKSYPTSLGISTGLKLSF